MEIFEKALIYSHVGAGTLALLGGLMAAFIGKKGGKLHRQVGGASYWSMFWIFVSALLLVSFVRFNFFLLIIAVFSYYMAFSGVRTLKIKKTGKVAMLDWVACGLTIAFGLSLFGYGLYRITIMGNAGALSILSLLFGFFTANTARQNLNIYRNIHKSHKMWWWLAHMNNMNGSLIACITAFLVQNGRIFDLPNSLNWLPWVLPAMAGAPLTAYYANKYRRQFKIGKYASA